MTTEKKIVMKYHKKKKHDSYTPIMKAPETRTGLRPTLSTQITAGIVETKVLLQVSNASCL